MENKIRINYINEYLKNKFGERTLKIGIDAGFTCPNRDGKLGNSGCAFCSERGSGDHLSSISIEDQITNYFNSYKSKRANQFILYFQNYTNTYDTIENLKMKYDTAINIAEKIIADGHLHKKIVGIAISTRPDCITEETANLLSKFNEKYYICVELGLQTSNDTTRNKLNCKYTSNDFSNAVQILNKFKIDVVAHIMVGLPYETHKDIENTIKFINSHNIQGVKIHSTYVVKNTELENLYNKKEYSPISLEEYLEELVYILTNLKQNIVIHRISGDAPKEILVAPEWNSHKKLVLNYIFKKFKEENLWQGMYYQI